MRGHLKKLGDFRLLREFRVAGDGEYSVGDKVGLELFEEGDLVDVVGDSRGRGFAGGVRRWNFRGGPKTHGQSDRHRAPGSIGSGTTPGRVYKGQKMAGAHGRGAGDVEEPAADRERRRQGPAAHRRRGPRRDERHGARAPRRQASQEEMTMKLPSTTPQARKSTDRGRRRGVRHRAERPGRAPGVRRDAGEQARRHRDDEDARRSRRLDAQDPPPEGRRHIAPGLDPARRSTATAASSSVRSTRSYAKDLPEAHAPAGDPLGAVGEGRRRLACASCSDLGDRDAEHEGDGRRAAGARIRALGARRHRRANDASVKASVRNLEKVNMLPGGVPERRRHAVGQGLLMTVDAVRGAEALWGGERAARRSASTKAEA